MTTPNMVLTLPVVSDTLGPQWATQLNEALEVVDAHDHSSGKGVKITPAGLNINADLEYNDKNITGLKGLYLNDALSGAGFSNVYQIGGNLYWRNGAGNDVQITAGTTINVGSLGTIGGDYSTDPLNPLITYTTSSGDYDFYKDTTGAPIPAGVNFGKVTIFDEVAGVNGITIQSPVGLSAAYSITLPTVQAASANSLIQSQGSGQWSYTRTPTCDTLGIGAGSLGSGNYALYVETNPTLGIYSSGADNWDFGTADARALNINEDQVATFFPAEISDFIPSAPGELKIGNAAIGNAEVALSMYSSGVNGWNRIVGVLGVSDDSGSNPVIQYDARRNTSTNFGTRLVMHQFSNNNNPLLDIERTRTRLYRNGDDDVLTLSSDSTENTVRQYFRNSDDTRDFNFSAFFSSGSEVLNIQSDAETFFQFFRGGNISTSKLINGPSGSISAPALTVGAVNTGLGGNGGNPFLSRAGVRRLELSSTDVFFASGMNLGNSTTERLGTAYLGGLNVSGAATITGALGSGAITATGNISTSGNLSATGTLSASNFLNSRTDPTVSGSLVSSSAYMLYTRSAGSVIFHGYVTVQSNGGGSMSLPIATSFGIAKDLSGFGVGSTGARIEMEADAINNDINVVVSNYSVNDVVYFTGQYDL